MEDLCVPNFHFCSLDLFRGSFLNALESGCQELFCIEVNVSSAGQGECLRSSSRGTPEGTAALQLPCNSVVSHETGGCEFRSVVCAGKAQPVPSTQSHAL